MDNPPPATSFLGEEISMAVLHHQLELDRFIAAQTEKASRDLSLQRRRHFLRIIASVENFLSLKLLSKEQELSRMEKINKALEERVHFLSLENQLWREIAEASEEKARALREEIEKMREVEERESRWDGGGAAAVAAACRRCGGAATVLLLPCRHLCLCAACGPHGGSCPVCACERNGSVNVNVL